MNNSKPIIVDESTPVVVGKYYNVRCAELIRATTKLVVGYVPVYAHAHKDPQFGVNIMHYHVDGRFVNRNDYIQVDQLGRTW